MRTYFFAYIATLICFTVLDFGWLSLTMNSLYKPRLASLLAETPNWPAILIFYPFYAAGIVALAVLPALDHGNWLHALFLGALLGLVAYGTYDLTNLATLKNWPITITVIDMAWGMVATGLASIAAFFIVRWIK